MTPPKCQFLEKNNAMIPKYESQIWFPNPLSDVSHPCGIWYDQSLPKYFGAICHLGTNFGIQIRKHSITLFEK